MTSTSQNLISSKKHLSALMLCLSTSILLINDPCFSAGKHPRSDSSDEEISYNKKRLKKEEDEVYKKTFKLSLSQLKNAQKTEDQDLRERGLKSLKSITTKEFHSEAEYLKGLIRKQGEPFYRDSNLEDAIYNFDQAIKNNSAPEKAYSDEKGYSPENAHYQMGLCLKKSQDFGEAEDSFRQVQQTHSPSRAQLGILLYKRSQQPLEESDQSDLEDNDSTNQKPNYLKLEALKFLKGASEVPEAAYKLGLIYMEENNARDLKKAENFLSYAEMNLETEVIEDKYGIHIFDEDEASKNERKKSKAAYYLASITWGKLQQDGANDLKSYLQRHKPEVRSILKYLEKAKKERTKIFQDAANLEFQINTYIQPMHWWSSPTWED